MNTISSTSNTHSKLLLHENLYYFYIQTEFNDKKEIRNNTFMKYVEPFSEDINNFSFALIIETQL